MNSEEIAKRLKLNITVLTNGRCREIASKPNQDCPPEPRVIIWNHQRDLAERVALQRSSNGELRAVKRVALQTGGSLSELSVINKITTAAENEKKRVFVDFKGWYSNQENIYFVMEYCPYGDIDQCYPAPLSEAEARAICGQLLDALAVLHGLGIAHRDIKPNNILVAEKMPIQVKLADFGISKHFEDTELKTQTGTFGYMAPEVLGLFDDGFAYTKAVDIWSLGCLLYKTLTRQMPFTSMPHLPLEKYVKGDSAFPEIPLLEKGISIDGRSFISRMLRPIPTTRPLASADLLDEWIIPKTTEDIASRLEDPVLMHTSAALEELKKGDEKKESETNRPQDWLQQGIMIEEKESTVSTESTIYKDEMDYASLELWHLVKRDSWLEDDKIRLGLLLESGANPNAIHCGYSALHLALTDGPSAKPATWVEILLKYGADPNLINKDGFYPTHQMVALVRHRAFRSIDDRLAPNLMDTCKFLLAHGARLELKSNGNGYTPLIYASKLRDAPMARFLIQNGSHIDECCHQERTALFYAAANGSLNIVKSLINMGANINLQDFEGATPLEAAARQTLNDGVIAYLVDNNAEHNSRDGGVKRRIKRAKLWSKIKRTD